MDRTVHARLVDGCEVVRYDCAGKWFVEGETDHLLISVRQAAQMAARAGSVAHLGLPGGMKFDVLVRALQDRAR